ncbi:uncharacterized protein VTP21DRAFT_279 [Calcarisporiella thermophila]|uniref:uncharacterized protein n=1 Tax=Calcarisporiella thermophila TaxID=911321 RepID=UPI003744AB34
MLTAKTTALVAGGIVVADSLLGAALYRSYGCHRLRELPQSEIPHLIARTGSEMQDGSDAIVYVDCFEREIPLNNLKSAPGATAIARNLFGSLVFRPELHLLRYFLPAFKHTCTTDHVRKLDFKVGEQVGVFKVDTKEDDKEIRFGWDMDENGYTYIGVEVSEDKAKIRFGSSLKASVPNLVWKPVLLFHQIYSRSLLEAAVRSYLKEEAKVK